MRHRKANVKLNRTASHRKAMFRNMVTSFFEHERIVTTEAKAKALRPIAEKLITLAKRGDLHSRRQALATITKKSIAHKLFDEIGGRYMDSSGGYTAIAKLGPRNGDAAPMAVITLVTPGETSKSKKKTSKKAAAKKAAETPVKEPEAAEVEPEVAEAEPEAPVDEAPEVAEERAAEEEQADEDDEEEKNS
ncbi:MAG: 50S ribosomal protein L17 [Deltaproteobacteria bacterium]|nr:50S ribosomal protein L17 [Deltaproteobacteria bacterium]